MRFCGNLDPGAGRHLLDPIGEVRLRVGERRKFEKERLKDQRLNHRAQNNQRHRRHPKIEPPPARALADRPVQDQDQDDPDRDLHKFSLGPVRQPRSPSLNRLLVLQGQNMAPDRRRQAQHIDGQQQERDNRDGLREARFGSPLRKIPKEWRDAKLQQQQQQEKP